MTCLDGRSQNFRAWSKRLLLRVIGGDAVAGIDHGLGYPNEKVVITGPALCPAADISNRQ